MLVALIINSLSQTSKFFLLIIRGDVASVSDYVASNSFGIGDFVSLDRSFEANGVTLNVIYFVDLSSLKCYCVK